MDQLVSACNDIAVCATLLHKVAPYFMALLQVIGALALLATALVRLPALKKYEGPVNTAKGKLLQVLKWMPTIGINPQTKKLEEAMMDTKYIDNE